MLPCKNQSQIRALLQNSQSHNVHGNTGRCSRLYHVHSFRSTSALRNCAKRNIEHQCVGVVDQHLLSVLLPQWSDSDVSVRMRRSWRKGHIPPSKQLPAMRLVHINYCYEYYRYRVWHRVIRMRIVSEGVIKPRLTKGAYESLQSL